ncbi:MAG: N-formylglutamate amidohydrolase [Silicimonas sp.]|nr:N-formylglutamate amidohydrolase [Silicimonas sp.]
MLHVTQTLPAILDPEDGPVAEVMNPGSTAPVCLVCEHASPFIPASLSNLGLASEHLQSHAVWDPGALALSRRLSEKLDAPLVACRVSRLVYDCNRPPEAPDAIPGRVEVIDIPGNQGLDAAARDMRARSVYDPFSACLSSMLDGFSHPPLMMTLHSFTPVWNGRPRATEIGLLHDDDPTLANAMMAASDGAFDVALNMPYSATDGVTHTLQKHANPRGLKNVMVEVRNDLLKDDQAIAQVATALLDMLIAAKVSETSA